MIINRHRLCQNKLCQTIYKVIIMNKDIVFNIDNNYKFNFRVAALIFQNNKLLLQTSKDEDFYALVGGRASLMEDTNETIIRECMEELGISLEQKDAILIDVVENFFEYRNTKYHELLFIYRIDLPNNIRIKDGLKTIDKDNNYNYWKDIKDIDKLNIKPVIIKDIYLNKQLNHHINKEI